MKTLFQTRFAMFVPCDIATYRKLKRLRHLAGFAEAMARRWSRAQRRLPHNRYFRRHRQKRFVTDAMLFSPFWQPAGSAQPTALLARFMEDYRGARHPVASAELVVPLQLTCNEIDLLLQQIESWHQTVFIPW